MPREFVNDAAEALKIKWRAFDPWSNLMTLVTVLLSRQESLNGICDVAKAIEYEWNSAGLELPRRNTLSNANMKRDPKMAENVFWKLLKHFKAISPAFVSSRFNGFLVRMKNHSVCTEQLVQGDILVADSSGTDRYSTSPRAVFHGKAPISIDTPNERTNVTFAASKHLPAMPKCAPATSRNTRPTRIWVK